jgi:hypothetical protein
VVPSQHSQKSKTIVTVMFYYSPEFAAVTPDIEGYINGLVANANLAYSESQEWKQSQFMLISPV